MRFHPSEEQIAIQDAVRGILAESWDAGRLSAFVDGDEDFDRTSWTALMALGLGGLMVPEAQGGAGLGLIDAAMAIEVAGEAAAPGPLAAQMLAAFVIAVTDNAQVKHHLAGLVAGTTIATLAFGNADVPDSWQATPAAGTMSFVMAANAANLFIVGTEGGGLAMIEATAVSIASQQSTDRTRRLSTVTYDDADSQILFAAGDPFVDGIFDAALVLIAADALGGAQHCVDITIAYAKERQQFGQPIGRFQALKHQLATMALEVEPARALLWYAAYAHDTDLPDRHRVAALTKAHLADRFVSVARAAVAAHGGIGYTWEHGLVHWFRRAVFDRAYFGSPAVHRQRAAALTGW